MTWDHVIPIARGGLDLPANLILACVGCNSDKGASTLEEYRVFQIALRNFHATRSNQRFLTITNWRFWGERRGRSGNTGCSKSDFVMMHPRAEHCDARIPTDIPENLQQNVLS
jgi:hypothetical protein